MSDNTPTSTEDNVPDTRAAAMASSSIDERLEDDESTEPSGPTIFISYRVHPDQPVAQAVRRLLETSFSPKPKVFVSGLGGLRPSAVTFKQQIQSAVQEAKAFIGIITTSSKDREWIFFEAGAAFGRNAIYVPLLIDCPANELPSSIADYQACKTEDRDDVERMLSSLAEQIGCDMRSHFGLRYAAFRRQLEEQKKLQQPANEGAGDTWTKAIDASIEGRTEEANTLWDQVLLESSGNDEATARTMIVRRFVGRKIKNRDVLKEMEEFESKYKATAQFAYWRGYLESRPSVAIDELRRAKVLAKGGYLAANAHALLAEKLAETGHESEALELLVDALRDDSRLLRDRSAETLGELISGCPPLSRLLLGVLHAADSPSSGTFANALSSAEEFDCQYLRLYLAERYDNEDGSGVSVNAKGRAQQALGLTSLAYKSYIAAGQRGVNVGIVNAANLATSSGVPSAGIALMDSHIGPFGSAQPDYPYRTRAQMEAAIAAEEQRSSKITRAGKRLFDMPSEFVERTIHGTVPPTVKKVSLKADSTAQSSVSMDVSDTDAGPQQCAPFKHMYTATLGETAVVALMGWTGTGEPVALVFDRSNYEIVPTWQTVVHAAEVMSQAEPLGPV